eukprot:scaffold9871_cov206-Skeletonema_marinoi.AAC.1
MLIKTQTIQIQKITLIDPSSPTQMTSVIHNGSMAFGDNAITITEGWVLMMDMILLQGGHVIRTMFRRSNQVEDSALVEGEEESIVAMQIRSITNKLELGDDDDDTCCSGEIDEPYYVSDERAG